MKPVQDKDAAHHVAEQDRSRFVSRMFGRIAGRYDAGNRVLSMGRDLSWRRRAVALLHPKETDVVLDIGAGTADLSMELAGRVRRVVAADFSVPMMHVGRGKVEKGGAGSRVRFVGADAHGLPFAGESFDGAAAAFTLRNLDRVSDGLAEVHRVLKPDACFVCLEFARPKSPLVNLLYRPYLHHVLPIIGSRIAGDRSAYDYLAESIEAFPAPPDLADRMREAGFATVEYLLLNLGTVAIHVARKGAGAAP